MARPKNINAALNKLEADYERKRKKILESMKGPLLRERRELEERLAEIDAELTKMDGNTLPVKTKPTIKKRVMWFRNEIEAAGKSVHATMAKHRKKEFSRKELTAVLPTKAGKQPTLADVIDQWNVQADKAEKIHHNGKDKALSRYLLH